MPELPEVETTRRHIEPVLNGATIISAELGRERMARRNMVPGDVARRLTGRRVERVGRRGKFLLIELDHDLVWVIHLGMSGRLQIVEPDVPLAPHTHLRVRMDTGQELRMIDPRTFGFVAVFTPEELASDPMSALGPDALESLPSAEDLGHLLRRRKSAIKAILLDQRFIAGLGNIYADEVLFRAGIRPDRPGEDVRPRELEALVEAIPLVLADGIEHGGTSLDDLAYLLPDGRAGEYLDRLAVYGRNDQPCLRCGTPIERIVVAQRSSHFCPRCQT